MELMKEIEDVKQQLASVAQSKSRANELIARLEKIEAEWTKALDDLNMKKQRYDTLIRDLEKAKRIMENMGFKIPWYKKLYLRLKK